MDADLIWFTIHMVWDDWLSINCKTFAMDFNIDDSDKELLNGINIRDPKAIERLFKFQYKVLCSYAYNILKNKEEAEDVASQAFFKLMDKRDKFDSLSSVRAYLYIIVRNKCFNLLMRRKVVVKGQQRVRNLYEDNTGLFFQALAKADLLQAVYDEINNLPRGQRKVFLGLYVRHLTPDEIAEELGISTQTVYNLKANGLKNLQKIFKVKILTLLFYFLSN
jgi:RNA polymerase sigma-70 factor (family 1)